MGLADDLSKSDDELRSGSTSICSVGLLLSVLDKSDRAALISALNDSMFKSTKIAAFLHNYGLTLLAEADLTQGLAEQVRLQRIAGQCATIGDNAIQRHRRGACKCDRGKL